MFRGISKKDANDDKLIQCGPDEIRMEDGTVRIMTETELLNRRIDDATEEVRGPFFVNIHVKYICGRY